MATLDTYRATVAGSAPAFTAASAGGDSVRPQGTLIVRNDSAGAVTVTIATPGTLPTGDAYPDKAYTVAAGGEAWILILPDYRDRADGLAHVTYSATASVTVAHVD
jgi:hypothetical protein